MSSILVVDDDADICSLITFKLELGGHEVHVESDGEAGLTAAIERQPDLVLLDWMMPRISGIEVCQKLRADGFDGPIILLTAKAQEADVEKGFAVGADDYIVKPFSPRELATRVDTLLQRVRT